jgi:hypothetical protein
MSENLIVTRGDTVVLDIYARRLDIATGQVIPIDLTGGKAWFTVKRESRDDDVDAVISLNTVDDPLNCSFVDPATQGLIRVTLDPQHTLQIKDRYLPFDVQIKELNGAVSTIENKMLELQRDVTRSVA